MKNFKFKIHENNYNVRIVSHEGKEIALEVNGTGYTVDMKDDVKAKKTPTLVRTAPKQNAEPVKMKSKDSKAKIIAPIPGAILSVNVNVGDSVKEGDLLLVLEAMKMENHITAEEAGTIKVIHKQKGAQVLQEEVLMELE